MFPGKETDRFERCEEILSIQAMGLKKRLEHTNCHRASSGIIWGTGFHTGSFGDCQSLRCFGVVQRWDERPYHALFWNYGSDISECMSVGKTNWGSSNGSEFTGRCESTFFRDIGHDPAIKDVTYENGQARERTQVLMDIANQCNGMVIGTGDLSELALGWATYNGDHMSM